MVGMKSHCSVLSKILLRVTSLLLFLLLAIYLYHFPIYRSYHQTIGHSPKSYYSTSSSTSTSSSAIHYIIDGDTDGDTYISAHRSIHGDRDRDMDKGSGMILLTAVS